MKKQQYRGALLFITSLLIFLAALSAHALPQPPSVMLNITVYITEDDKENFHRSGCGLLYGKQITGIPLCKAYKEGYTPCGHCKPPQINGM